MRGATDPSAPAGLEPASSGRALSALPVGQRRPRYDLPLLRGATAHRACAYSPILCQARRRRFSFSLCSCVSTFSFPLQCKADVPQTSLLLPWLFGRPSRLLCVHAAYSLCTRGVWHSKLANRQPALCFSLSISRAPPVTDDILQVPFQVQLSL